MIVHWNWLNHASKVCSRMGRKWKVIIESHEETCINMTSFVRFKIFLSNLLLNHILCYWPNLHCSILKICHEFQDLSSQWTSHLSEVINRQWKLSKKCAKRNEFNSNLCPITVEHSMSNAANIFFFSNFVCGNNLLTGFQLLATKSDFHCYGAIAFKLRAAFTATLVLAGPRPAAESARPCSSQWTHYDRLTFPTVTPTRPLRPSRRICQFLSGPEAGQPSAQPPGPDLWRTLALGSCTVTQTSLSLGTVFV